jgi:hypothetical protein
MPPTALLAPRGERRRLLVLTAGLSHPSREPLIFRLGGTVAKAGRCSESNRSADWRSSTVAVGSLITSERCLPRVCVNGHLFLPDYGHVFSPLAAIFSPQHVGAAGVQVRAFTPLPAVAWASR